MIVVTVHAGQALDGADGTALGKSGDDGDLTVKAENVHWGRPIPLRGDWPPSD